MAMKQVPSKGKRARWRDLRALTRARRHPAKPAAWPATSLVALSALVTFIYFVL